MFEKWKLTKLGANNPEYSVGERELGDSKCRRTWGMLMETKLNEFCSAIGQQKANVILGWIHRSHPELGCIRPTQYRCGVSSGYFSTKDMEKFERRATQNGVINSSEP